MNLRIRSIVNWVCFAGCLLVVQSIDAKCIDNEDYTLEQWTQLTARVGWVSFNSNEEIAKDLQVSERFAGEISRLWPVERVSLLNISSKRETNGIVAITTNLSMTMDEKGETLTILDRMLDCSKGCRVVNEKPSNGTNSPSRFFEFEPSPSLIINSIKEPNNRFFLRGKIKIVTSNMSNNWAECTLCKQIQDTKAKPANSQNLTGTLWGHVSGAFQMVSSKLEPNQWLALIVINWLITCFVIAIFIQKRDRRRLRLYLEERADDYSFSKR